MATTFWARTDSNSANNAALNLKPAGNDPALEITFVKASPTGDLSLETNGGAADPDTLVEIDGVTYSFVYQFSGTMPTRNNQGAGQVPDQYEGSVTYVITVLDYPAPGQSTRLAFLPEENATEAEMNAFGNGAIDIQNLNTNPPPGPVCFGPGTLILTPGGDVPVEDLSAGDLVLTKDHGAQPLVWVSSSSFSWPGDPETAKPVHIPAGALGGGLPLRDLIVSPQHKLLMEAQAFGLPTDRLAPAKGFVGCNGVREMAGKKAFTYHHLAFARHQVIFSEGAASESFYPGPQAMRLLSAAQKLSLKAACPAVSGPDPVETYGPAAREGLSVRETREVLENWPGRVRNRKLAAIA